MHMVKKVPSASFAGSGKALFQAPKQIMGEGVLRRGDSGFYRYPPSSMDRVATLAGFRSQKYSTIRPRSGAIWREKRFVNSKGYLLVLVLVMYWQNRQNGQNDQFASSISIKVLAVLAF
jgi:hypothetical protein